MALKVKGRDEKSIKAKMDEADEGPGYELTYTDDKSTEGGSYLFVGRPGTGKTHIASQFPEGRLWLNIDRGLRTVRNLHDPKVDITGHRNLWLRVLQILWDIADRKGPFAKQKIRTVIIDDFSRLSQKLEVEVLEDPPVGEGKEKPEYLDALRIQDYNTVGLRLVKIINTAKDIANVALVGLMGVSYEVDGEHGLIDQPDATGKKLGPKIPHYFDSVIYMERVEDSFISRIAPTKRFPYARIRYIGDVPTNQPNRVENLSYETLRLIEEKKFKPPKVKAKAKGSDEGENE